MEFTDLQLLNCLAVQQDVHVHQCVHVRAQVPLKN